MNNQPLIACKSYAKINLFLDILGIDRGMHNLLMVMQSVSLHDILEFFPENRLGIFIESNNRDILENNIIQKVYERLREDYPGKITKGFRIKIQKNIPLGAGLGGGSANAAVAIEIFNKFFKLGLKGEELIKFNYSIGSDVNFCYSGGTKCVSGKGEQMTGFFSPYKYFLLVYPDIHISTKEAYRLWDTQQKKYQPLYKSAEEIGELKTLYNAFESIIFPMYPEIRQLKEKLLALGATHALMTGSGSTVFGIFENKEVLNLAFLSIKKTYKNAVTARKINKGKSFLKNSVFFVD